MTAFVLGNGVSRRAIDLTRLKSHGTVYGCNALYREFTPDVLVATDRPIAIRIQESGYSATNRFYTRKPLPNQGAKQVPKEYYGNSSGPIACAIAAIDGHKEIYLIGFDIGPDSNNTFNNVYAGTEFYKAAGTSPVYTGNWITQILKVLKNNPAVGFCRVCSNTTADIGEFSKILNLKNCDLTAFCQKFNC